MPHLVTSAQMRDVERAAIQSGAVTGAHLMERAGTGVVAALLQTWPVLAERSHRAAVLCGPGNNGGDGYVIARLLAARGWQVELYALGDPARLPPDAASMHCLWAALGNVYPLDPPAMGEGPRPDVIIDALFGTGLSRAIPELAVDALRTLRKRRGRHCRTVAVDCPSGLHCDTGTMLLPAPPSDSDQNEDDADAHIAWWNHAQRWINRADLTVTFHAAKIGHYLGQGPGLCGQLVTHDIGIAEWDTDNGLPGEKPQPDRVRLVGQRHHGRDLPGRMWPGQLLPTNGTSRHKYDRGHVLVLAGGVGRGGAARLAARAALRVGAGLVTIGCPRSSLQENAARLDAIMLRSVRDAEALSNMLTDTRLRSLCLGPGLGLSDRTRDLVYAALAAPAPPYGEHRATILDADALTVFANNPDALFERLHPRCVLTPHEGEFARLFPDLAEVQRAKSQFSKVDAARMSADRAGCTILLKGQDTVIASPGGHASLHAASYERTAPWLGTAGAGDVLAGLIAGLAAPNLCIGSLHMVTETAAWLHVEAARQFGPGLIAEDLPEQLPAVFRALDV